MPTAWNAVAEAGAERAIVGGNGEGVGVGVGVGVGALTPLSRVTVEISLRTFRGTDR
jgi:hypothetical protein